MTWDTGTFMDRIGPAAASRLIAAGNHRALRRGAPLFLEGELADQVAVVVDGRLKLVTVSLSGVESLLAVVGRGELIGEISVFDGSPRSATVSALGPAEVVVVRRAEFERFLTQNGGAALEVIRQLCDRMRVANDARTDLSSDPVRVRLARRLEALASDHGVADPSGGIRISLPVTQVELGAWIGASREAVARELGELRGSGVVRTDRRCIIIDDPEGLGLVISGRSRRGDGQ